MYDKLTNDQLEAIWDWNLSNHVPTQDGTKKIETLREMAKDFAEGIIKLCPTSRERSLSLTGLEHTLYDAIAAVARYETIDGSNPSLPDTKEAKA